MIFDLYLALGLAYSLTHSLINRHALVARAKQHPAMTAIVWPVSTALVALTWPLEMYTRRRMGLPLFWRAPE